MSGSSSGSGSEAVPDLDKIADQTLDLVGDRADAEVLAVATRAGLTRFANSVIHQHVGEATTSVRLRLAADGHVASAQTSRTNRQGLEDFVEATLAAAAVRPVDPDWPGLAPPAPVADLGPADAETREADARPLFEALLRQGVIVRPLAGFGAPGAIRVTVGTPDENEFLDAALGRVGALSRGMA
jgi:hypothetical protein